MQPAVHVFDRLLQIALLLQHDMAQSLEAVNLTPARTHLLWEVHHRGPSTQQSLAAALRVTPRNVTGLVDALGAAGYVRRQPHPTDRRATLVTLTELGERTMTVMAAERERLAAELTGGLELAQLGHHLDVIADRLAGLVEAQQAGSARR
jgi:DNA-binding MarR family transcriptional regulator